MENVSKKNPATPPASAENTMEAVGPRPKERSHAQQVIGQKLQEMYAQMLSEPIPTRIIDLLEQLDAVESAEAERKSNDGGQE